MHHAPHAYAILVVDDDVGVKELIAEFLTDMGHVVLQASGGLEALQVISEQPRLDLVISDIKMPGITGIELAGILATQRATLPIILMSGFYIPQPLGWRVLFKPFRFQELEQAICEELVLSSADSPCCG